MVKQIDIHKAAGIIIKDKKLLITRSKGKTAFISPGGKIEGGESAPEALVRELKEELQIDVAVNDLKEFGTFYAFATGNDGKYLRMDVFLVETWKGDILPASEIEEVMWVGSVLPEYIELGSIFRHEVLPRLAAQGFID
jgi:mutator protein MutT